jgi:hypothetical protein
VFLTECYVYIPKELQNKFDNKSVFGRMIGYLKDKDGYQVYVPCLKKIVHSHVYFKPERVCTISVVKMGLNNAAVEDVVAEKGKMMIQCRGRHSQRKFSRWRPRKSLIRKPKVLYARSSGQCVKHQETTFFRQHSLLFLVVDI